MNPFFFGSTGRPLYGVHHEPESHEIRHSAVLICYPFGREYMRSHRALVRFCNRLAASGYHSMRFDYFGTGDSAGDSGEGNVNAWIDDTLCAVQELRDVSGTGKVTILGVRLGAAIALHAAAKEPAVETLLLWDPVVYGGQYIDRLEVVHSEFVTDVHRFPEISANSPARGSDELVGMVCPSPMRQTIRSLDLTGVEKGNIRHVSIIATEDRDEFRILKKSLGSQGADSRYHVVNEEIAWDTLADLGVVLMPNALLQVMADTVVTVSP